jgi:GNAT superfamily N-acetyltransferase
VKSVPSAPEHGPGLERLFQKSESPCHCRYWHFTGDKNAWLDRCYNHTSLNRDEMLGALAAGNDEMRGMVALDDAEDVIGWMKLAPARSVQKLYDTRLYKGLPVLDRDPEGILAVGCFLILEDWQGKGVAHSLLQAGIAEARASGARAIEAFPRNAEGVSGQELWTGPVSVFQKAGFETIHDFHAYPVLRLIL